MDGLSWRIMNKTKLAKIPATVFVGFLGSGKTTIISHLIDFLVEQQQKIVYIKNEVGNTDIDTQLLADKKIETKELLNGCICCTLVGSLNNAIDQLAEQYHPDRFLIESAGTADPESLALTISHHPRLIRDGVISVIDVVNFNGYDHLDSIAQTQAKFNDLIVFNKVELVDAQRKQAVVGYIRELNETSPIVEAPQGILDPRLAFGISSTLDLVAATHHHHHDEIDTYVFNHSGTFNQEKLKQVLTELPANVLRVKGFVVWESGEMQVLNGVAQRFEFLTAPTSIKPHLEILCIGYHLSSINQKLTALFEKALSQH